MAGAKMRVRAMRRQIQKYENGKNRLSGSRLIKAAETLKVSPAQLLGANGSGKADGEFDALAEPAVNIMVREMKKLPLINDVQRRWL